MELIIGLVILIFSAILHEVAHGFVADRLGDPTARLMGRLTLNPKSHIDPFMSLALPLLLLLSGSPVIFGAAKPVPVDPFNLKEGRKDLALVALSGPLTNIVLAILASFLIKLISLPIITSILSPFLFAISYFLFAMIMKYNLLLAILNLLPIPPLDGSKVFSLLLPQKEANAYLSLGSIGMFILFFLLLFPIGGFSLGDFMFNLLSFAESLLLP
ncbi:MAG: site-2 protease family protein [Candidatus Taylorbacteria bacterium]|nr:site-2 protease family protein [Candidatus Taylorbacteria bacterium]